MRIAHKFIIAVILLIYPLCGQINNIICRTPHQDIDSYKKKVGDILKCNTGQIEHLSIIESISIQIGPKRCTYFVNNTTWPLRVYMVYKNEYGAIRKDSISVGKNELAAECQHILEITNLDNVYFSITNAVNTFVTYSNFFKNKGKSSKEITYVDINDFVARVDIPVQTDGKCGHVVVKKEYLLTSTAEIIAENDLKEFIPCSTSQYETGGYLNDAIRRAIIVAFGTTQNKFIVTRKIVSAQPTGK